MTITVAGTTITFSDSTTQSTGAYFFPSGTAMLFQQTSAPTGWTKSTTYNNYAIRIVSGTASTGGSVAFTTAFASQAVTGTNSGGAVSATSLSTAQLAYHTHLMHGGVTGGQGGYTALDQPCPGGITTYGAGCNASHSHGFTQPTFSGTAINLAVQYVDHIIATKN